jgi:hypothetical protein
MRTPVALAIAVLTACAATSASGDRCSVEDFLALPYAEQTTGIRDCSPAQQVDLYMRTVERTHPPEIALADSIAPTGPQLVPALLEELTYRTSHAAQVEFLVYVFLRMKNLGYYDASNDPLVIGDISKGIESIGEPETKAWCNEMLESIRSNKKGSE